MEKSVQTRGRTLDHAAPVYDIFEPMLMLGKQSEYDRKIRDLLFLKSSDRILDLGCGTGVLTRLIGDRLDPARGGVAMGIDAASRMIELARKKRQTAATKFDTAAAEALPYEDRSFDGVVSSLFFHHVDMDLKKRALSEAFRVLKPGGKLIIADMHTPSTFMGAAVSHVARRLFFQPEIGENIRGVLPGLIEQSGFIRPAHVKTYFGYIAIFTSRKP